MTIGENIKRIREANNLTQEEFGKIADVSSMAVSQWENDRAVPRMGAVQAISDYFGIPKGEIIDDEQSVSFVRFPGVMPVSYAVVGSVEVPVLGKVHAGEPLDHDAVEDTTRIPDFVYAKDPDVFMIHSEGDCVNKLFGENDDFAVSPNTKPKNGSVVVAKLMKADEEEYIIRQYFRTAQTLILSPCSYNPEHKDIIITADSDMSAEISGVIIWNQARRLMD